MSDVFIIVDSRGNERYFTPLYEWADECSSFFVPYMIYPPFDTVKAFCSRGELNNGMSGFLLWEGFNIDQKIYMDIFGSLKKRFKHLVRVESAAISHDINDEDDLTAWRQEIPLVFHLMKIERFSEIFRGWSLDTRSYWRQGVILLSCGERL